MAIEALYLSLLAAAIRQRRKAAAPDQRLRALALGYPDMLVQKTVLDRLFGAELMADLPVREDAAEIWAWHGLKGGRPLYDSVALFDRLGIDVTVSDMTVIRGMERVVDLNEPLPDNLRAQFDLVIDTGTCEHCFNVGMAFRNTCEALDAGGYLVHAAPLSRFNHGFWGFSPTIYPDYFGDNGFRLHYMKGVAGSLSDGYSTFPVEKFSYFDAPAKAVLYVVAERVEVRPQVWPVQRKYRRP